MTVPVDEARLRELNKRYKERLNEQIGELQRLVGMGDFHGAEAIAHTIHGTAGSFGLHGVSRQAARLELSLQRKNGREATGHLERLNSENQAL
jgi:HPt (histidine-containing phosphotransfer) domain-containing protein